MKLLANEINKFYQPMFPAIWSRLFDLLLPPRCHACRGPLSASGPLHICPQCREQCTPIASPLCSCCGIPFATENGSDHPCGDCLQHPPPFAAARAAFVYDGTLRDLIHRFKYRHQVRLRRPLGQLMASELAEPVTAWQPDLIVPVPLHPRRLRERGFNQAILLGTFLAREWHIPLARTALDRIRWTVPQIELDHHERAANVRGAFAVRKPAAVAGKRILLLDDVLTTGSTATECARVLGKAKAAEVFVGAVARALPGR